MRLLKLLPQKNGGSRTHLVYDEDHPSPTSVDLGEDLEADLTSSHDVPLDPERLSNEAILNEVFGTATASSSRVNTTITTGPVSPDRDDNMALPAPTDHDDHNNNNNRHERNRNGRPKRGVVLRGPIKGLFSKSPKRNKKELYRASSTDSSIASARGAHFRCLSLSLFLILLVGLSACTTILWVGIASIHNSEHAEFNRNVEEIIQTYEQFMSESLLLGMWKHQACREAQESVDPRRSFRRFWEYVNASTLATDTVSCAVKVTHDERASFENETLAFLIRTEDAMSRQTGVEHNISSKYIGFKALQLDPATGQGTGVKQTEKPFYFPLHYVEPIDSPVVPLGIDLDAYSFLPETIEAAMSTGLPVCSGRHLLFDRTYRSVDYPRFGVTLCHPGVTDQFDDEEGNVNRHLAIVSIAFNDVLKHAYQAMNLYNQRMTIIIYDSTNDTSSFMSSVAPEGPVFLGGGILHQDGIIRHENTSMEFMDEISLEEALNRYKAGRRRIGSFYTIQKLSFASREWTVFLESTKASNGSPDSHLAFIALGAALILIATICLCCLIYSNARRIRYLNRLKASVEAEKSALKLDSARKAAQQERELNDFIAHEVRNPLNAALSANSFVSASVNDEVPLRTEESRRSVREDVQIIESSLQFINDLLRNMLDMHRAASHQLQVEWAFVEVLRDILEPVANMIYRRGAPFEVIVDIPPSHQHLIIETDPLRLKQIMLNLGRNAAKFVQKGFVRFRTDVIDDEVHLYVEDSGPGVPQEKRNNLFGRFQESLDTLNQGTGIGLALCKSLTELLHGKIWLDESYDSGIPGNPGSCFVVNLRTQPIDGDDAEGIGAIDSSEHERTTDSRLGSQVDISLGTKGQEPQSSQLPQKPVVLTDCPVVPYEEQQQLPKGLKVLFVDDDFTLRKLFVRAVTRVTEDWIIEEASNGETALSKVKENEYDLIFMDMYMASVSKQLTGTETTRELRSMGCKSLICGLSANDMETQFYDAGADDYVMKPFPCRVDPLRHELHRIISKKSSLFSCSSGGFASEDCDETEVGSSSPSSSLQ